MNKGFTLVELIVVFGIVALLSGILLVNMRGGERELALRRSAQKVMQAVREAQNKAFAGNDYGVRFIEGTEPVVFSDSNRNGSYDAGEEVRSVALEATIDIVSCSPSCVSYFELVFVPPNPDVVFSSVPAGDAVITLQDDSGNTQNIYINQMGIPRL